MAGNNFLMSRSVSFGRNYSLRVMPSHATACIIYSCYRWLRDLTVFPRVFQGWKPSVFLEKECSFLSYAPWYTVPIAAFNVNNACPFKYRTYESEIEQVPIYTSCREKLKRKKDLINKPQNSSKMVIVLRSIHRVEKYTHLERKKPLKCLNIFLKWLYLYIWYVLRNVNMICIFTWNVIACFFLWTWSCFSNFSWCVKRPITFAWRCFQKRYRGPSVLFTYF